MFWTNLFFNVAFSALFGLGLADQVMETPLVVHQEYDCVCPDGVCPISPAGYVCPVNAPVPSLPGPIVPVGFAPLPMPASPYSVEVCVTGGPRDCAPTSTKMVVLPNATASLERIGVDKGESQRQVLQVTLREAGPGCVEVDLNVTAVAVNQIIGADTGRTRTTTFRGTHRIPLGRSIPVVLSGSAPEPCTAEVTVAPIAPVPQLVAMPVPHRMPLPVPVPPPSPYNGFVPAYTPVSTPTMPSPVRTASLLPEPLPLPYPPPDAVTCQATTPKVCQEMCAAACPKACATACPKECGKCCQTACAAACSKACAKGCQEACARECGKCCQEACAANCSKACATVCSAACAKECGKCCSKACAAACSKACAKGCQEACARECGKCCPKVCATACSKEYAKTCPKACAAACSKACDKACATSCSRECGTGCAKACVASNTAFQPCIVNVPALGNRTSHVCIVREDGASRVQMKTDGLSATFIRTTLEAGEVGKLRLAAGSKHVHVSGQGWKAQAERVEVRHGGQVVLCGNVKLESDHLGVAASVRAESLTVQLRQGRFEKVCRQAE